MGKQYKIGGDDTFKDFCRGWSPDCGACYPLDLWSDPPDCFVPFNDSVEMQQKRREVERYVKLNFDD